MAQKSRLVVVDSSVWIDFFSPAAGVGGAELNRMISGAEPFAITGIVVAEVLQGLKRNVNAIESYLFQWQMLEPQGFTTYRETAAIFRAARARGISVTTTDALIAAITLENNATLFTLDRDFVHLASVINLPLHPV